MISTALTDGRWNTEALSARAFDDCVDKARMAKQVYKEVHGAYFASTIGQELKTPRIDRIVSPSKALLDAGWSLGPFGVEIKRSGEKLGRPISQCIDYRHAVWDLSTAEGKDVGPPGFHIILEWVFLWPCPKIGGPLAALMAQHRIGEATAYRDLLSLKCGGQTVFSQHGDGSWGVFDTNVGSKRGSR